MSGRVTLYIEVETSGYGDELWATVIRPDGTQLRWRLRDVGPGREAHACWAVLDAFATAASAARTQNEFENLALPLAELVMFARDNLFHEGSRRADRPRETRELPAPADPEGP